MAKSGRLAVSAVGGVVMLALASGCGSSGTSAGNAATSGPSDASQQAQAAVTAALTSLPWKAPGQAFNATADLTGKSITFISVALNYQYSRAIATGISDGAKVFGATVNAVDANGDPTTAGRQISTAVSQGAAGIVVQGFPAALLAQPLKAAHDKGIPIVMVNEVEQGLPTAEQQSIGVFGNSSSCFSCGGKLMADMAVAKYGQNVNAVFIGANSLGDVAVGEQAAFKSELARLCPQCKAKYLDIGVAQWATDVAPATTSALTDRTVNVIAPLYDLEDAFVTSAVSAAQANDRVSVVSLDATLPGLQDVAKGKPMLGDVGGSANWQGWNAFDQLLRAVNQQPPAPDAVVAMRVFTSDNVGPLDLRESADQVAWYSSADLRKEFSALWKRA